GTNLGFAAGVNRALDEVWDGRADVLLLNPDARLAASHARDLQAALRQDPRRAAVGPRLVGTDGAAQRPTWPLPSPAQAWAEALGLARWWRGPRFVTGAVLLL